MKTKIQTKPKKKTLQKVREKSFNEKRFKVYFAHIHLYPFLARILHSLILAVGQKLFATVTI